MVSLTVGDQEFTYERVAKNRSENVFEVVLVVESRTGELSVRRFELDVDARDDLSTEFLEGELEAWQESHDNLTIHRLVVRETNRCVFGTRITEPLAEREDGDGEVDAAGGAPDPVTAEGGPLYRGASASAADVGFADVDVDHGDEVEYYVAGPSTSVYGTDTGTVTGVKSGTDQYHVLLVETDSGTRRVREDWLVDGDDEDGEASDDENDADGDGDE